HRCVGAVIYGHIHQELDFERNGVRYFCTPSTCIQFKPNVADFTLDELNPAYRWYTLHNHGAIDSGVVRLTDFVPAVDHSATGYELMPLLTNALGENAVHDRFFLLYLHGFNSSPLSHKARQTHDYWVSLGLGDYIGVPELDHEPARAIEELQEIIEAQELPVALIGSSLGGYYATWLAEEYGLRAALVNPAVNPAELWQAHLGINRNYYSGRRYEITESHI